MLFQCTFCYLGDILYAGVGCELIAVTCWESALGKFHQLFPILTNGSLPSGEFILCEVLCNIIAAAETWAMYVATLNRLRRNDSAMIRRICNVKANYEINSDFLLSKFGLQNLDVVLRSSWTRWFRHVECSKGWISQVRI